LKETTLVSTFFRSTLRLDQKILKKIINFRKNTLNDDGMIIEHSKYTKLDHMDNFSFKKTYGGSIFSFFELSSGEEELDADLFKEDEEE
jgi:hypothetical protein